MLNRIAALLACASTGVALAAGGWTFQVLPTLGGNASWATGINNSGQVVGWAGVRKGEFTDIDPEFHAFTWFAGTMRDLGSAGGNESARAVSDFGDIVGSSDAGIVVWGRYGRSTLPFRGTPNRILRSGAIAGTYDSAAGDFRGFLYQRNGTLAELATLGGTWSTVAAINERGVMVGSSATASGAVRGFVQRDGVMKAIPTFGGAVSQAYDVNDRGVVVGSAGNTQGGVVPFIDDGVMRPLFPAANPGDIGEAFAINEHGQVIGVLNDQGFLWSDNRLTMLRDLLPAEDRARWGVLTPSAINNRGWIVGVASTEGVNGIAGGYRRAFVLKPR